MKFWHTEAGHILEAEASDFSDLIYQWFVWLRISSSY